MSYLDATPLLSLSPTPPNQAELSEWAPVLLWNSIGDSLPTSCSAHRCFLRAGNIYYPSVYC